MATVLVVNPQRNADKLEQNARNLVFEANTDPVLPDISSNLSQ